MVEVHRKEGETIGAMLRRFTRRVQQSGVLNVARKAQFYNPHPSRRAIKMKALRRIEKMKEIARLEKLGKLKKEE
jgi:ribosomal protein S21